MLVNTGVSLHNNTNIQNYKILCNMYLSVILGNLNNDKKICIYKSIKQSSLQF